MSEMRIVTHAALDLGGMKINGASLKVMVPQGTTVTSRDTTSPDGDNEMLFTFPAGWVDSLEPAKLLAMALWKLEVEPSDSWRHDINKPIKLTKDFTEAEQLKVLEELRKIPRAVEPRPKTDWPGLFKNVSAGWWIAKHFLAVESEYCQKVLGALTTPLDANAQLGFTQLAKRFRRHVRGYFPHTAMVVGEEFTAGVLSACLMRADPLDDKYQLFCMLVNGNVINNNKSLLQCVYGDTECYFWDLACVEAALTDDQGAMQLTCGQAEDGRWEIHMPAKIKPSRIFATICPDRKLPPIRQTAVHLFVWARLCSPITKSLDDADRLAVADRLVRKLRDQVVAANDDSPESSDIP